MYRFEVLNPIYYQLNLFIHDTIFFSKGITLFFNRSHQKFKELLVEVETNRSMVQKIIPIN